MSKATGVETSAAVKWARHVEQLEKSGLSVREFAVREGLKAGTLSFWKWKLTQRERVRAGGARVEPLRFVELTTAPPAAPVAVAGFEVLLGSSRTIRVPGGFDAAELVRLVRVLEEARS